MHGSGGGAPGPPARTPLGRWWRAARPYVFGIAAISVLVLGTIGYTRLDLPEGHYGFWDSLFRAIRLFGLEGVLEPKLPWELLVAGIIGPILTVYAAAIGLLRLFQERLLPVRIRLFARDHVIVVGLGGLGARLAISLADGRRGVVAVEVDPAAVNASGCLERGIPVLVGNGADAEVLGGAGLTHAARLVVTCGDDGTNLDVAHAARELAGARKGRPLDVSIHLSDVPLWRRLSAEAVADPDSPVRLDYFNSSAAAMRMLVSEHPPFADERGVRLENPRVGIVGLDEWGQNLLIQIARLWRGRSAGERLPVIVSGPDVAESLEDLMARHPDLDSICDVEVRPARVSTAALQSGEVLLDADGHAEVDRVFVCLPRAADSLGVALGLHRQRALAGVGIVVVVPDTASGVARALEAQDPALPEIAAFGAADVTRLPDLMLNGIPEAIARAKHEAYVRAELARGMSRETNSSLVEWEELPEPLRESNRRFADGVGASLAAAGYTVVPSLYVAAHDPPVELSQDEVDTLGRGEHDRWMRDLVRDGWKPTDGPKDGQRKLHPLLVPWEELDEVEREKDRAPMRELPQTLASVGLEVRRMRGHAPPREPSATLA